MKKETKNFVKDLFGNYFAATEGRIELRMIPEGSGAPFSKFYSYGVFETDGIYEKVKEWNKTHHIYFGVNPRPLNEGKKEADVKNVVCLWADIDSKDFPNPNTSVVMGDSIGKLPKEKQPSIVVSSGHGLHYYWLLKEPILNMDDEARLNFKQILSGLVKTLGGDVRPMFLNCLLRFPGTLNLKDKEPRKCQVVGSSAGKEFSLNDFEEFRNTKYNEPIQAPKAEFDFGKSELIISKENLESAKEDANKLKIDPVTKKRIITGTLLTAKDADKSRSGRDISIIWNLIYHGYNYATIKSIFTNPHLGCSDRIKEKGEVTLQRDTNTALANVKKFEKDLSPERKAIADIRRLQKTSRETKLRYMAGYITDNLLSGESPAGKGYKDIDRSMSFYFDEETKMPINVKSDDFYYFLRKRFDIMSQDIKELRDAILTEIWQNGKEAMFHLSYYFNKTKFMLYLSDFDNKVYRLNGKKIEHLVNGTDGVFFIQNTEFTPFKIDLDNLDKSIRYFEKKRDASIKFCKLKLTLRGRKIYGFRLLDFMSGDSLLKRYLLDIACFEFTEKNLTPMDQEVQLMIYFYSLFFESIMTEKPLACFVGQKDSGKSTIGSLIGRIIFGSKFQCRACPDNIRDLQVLINDNPFLMLDNVDHKLRPDFMDALCMIATGGSFDSRELFTNLGVIRIKPKTFLGITTREANFKRPDVWDRTLLFKFKPVVHRIQRNKFFRDIEDNRNAIMSEILVNLNSIISILHTLRKYNPECAFRIADWETFGRKITAGSAMTGVYFKDIIRRMNIEKSRSILEDDMITDMIIDLVLTSGRSDLGNITTKDLFKILQQKAKEDDQLNAFNDCCKSVGSLGKLLNSRIESLKVYMNAKVRRVGHNLKMYSFVHFDEGDIDGDVVSDVKDTVSDAPNNVSKDEPVLSEVERLMEAIKKKEIEEMLKKARRKSENKT